MIDRRRSLIMCAAWIGGILIAGSLFWFFTQNFRTRILVQSVNKAFVLSGDARQISVPEEFPVLPGTGMGAWFPLDRKSGADSGSADGAGASSVLVFTMMRGGLSAACAAVVDSSGIVEKIIPLSGNAAQIVEELPQPVYKMYVERVEKAASLREGGRR